MVKVLLGRLNIEGMEVVVELTTPIIPMTLEVDIQVMQEQGVH